MDWWTSVVDGAKKVSYGIGQGATWVWNNTTLTNATIGIFTYAANTGFEILRQGLALRTAIPALWYKPESRRIFNGMAYVLLYDVMPIVNLGYLNSQMQTQYRLLNRDDTWYLAYAVGDASLQIIDCMITSYSAHQAIKALIHISVLDTLGPSAFKANSPIPPLTRCIEEECTNKRLLTGFLREPIILATNDLIIFMARKMPYIGPMVAEILTVGFGGRYIARGATIELCERHKLEFVMKETIMALGITYYLTSNLMNFVLTATVGMPGYFYHRTLLHLLLLGHVNMAAHMHFPLVKPDEATLRYDPLDMYESVWRFISDVIFAGLAKRIPIDFKPVDGAPPLFQLTPTLQYMTKKLRVDLEPVKVEPPSLFVEQANKLKVWVLPPIVQDYKGFATDPIIHDYWKAILSGVISSINSIEAAGKTRTTATLAMAPNTVAKTVQLVYGVPKKMTKILLMLSKEEDFWDFAKALREWCIRHNNVDSVAEMPANISKTTSLHGAEPLRIAPASSGKLVATAEELQGENKRTTVASVLELTPEPSRVDTLGIFAVRRRGAGLTTATVAAPLSDGPS